MPFLLTEEGGGWKASGLAVGIRIPEEGSYHFFHLESARRPKVCWPQCFHLASFSVSTRELTLYSEGPGAASVTVSVVLLGLRML